MCACEPVPEPPRCNPDFHEALFYSDVKDTNALKDHPILCLNDSTPFNFRYDEEIE